MAFLDPVLNPVLQPLLDMSPFWGIIILALIITLIITLAYKFFTNQNEMKRLKDQQKEFQKRMKELKDKPEEMMKIQKEAMKANLEYMKHSFKVTLITFIPIILIFGWMNGHLTYEPIFPGEIYSLSASFNEGIKGEAELIVDSGTEFSLDENVGKLSTAKQEIANSQATWFLRSEEGEHFLRVKMNDAEQSKKVLITKKLRYEEPLSVYEHSPIKQIMINYNKLKPLGKDISLFGWRPGWLGLYIILSLIFSLGLRKLLNIY